MKKITNSGIIQELNILKTYEDKKIPYKIAHAIAKNLQIVNGEYELYTKSLQKLLDRYKDHFIKDEKGNVSVDKSSGLPIVDSNAESYVKDINDLLSWEIEIEPYYIDESELEYEPSEYYEVLTPKDIFILMELLCKNEKDE